MKGTPAKILLVQVKNLKGETVWTFPKGHLEEGETAQEAAVREVWEETGWNCKISPEHIKPFMTVQYFFKKGPDLIRKQVIWFRMEALEKTGTSDPNEILDSRWATLPETAKLIKYPSDKTILKELQATIE